jgi:hypothetical protein
MNLRMLVAECFIEGLADAEPLSRGEQWYVGLIGPVYSGSFARNRTYLVRIVLKRGRLVEHDGVSLPLWPTRLPVLAALDRRVCSPRFWR